jgi:hypothetical protein
VGGAKRSHSPRNRPSPSPVAGFLKRGAAAADCTQRTSRLRLAREDADADLERSAPGWEGRVSTSCRRGIMSMLWVWNALRLDLCPTLTIVAWGK